jgi:hypothetical protein
MKVMAGWIIIERRQARCYRRTTPNSSPDRTHDDTTEIHACPISTGFTILPGPRPGTYDVGQVRGAAQPTVTVVDYSTHQLEVGHGLPASDPHDHGRHARLLQIEALALKADSNPGMDSTCPGAPIAIGAV